MSAIDPDVPVVRPLAGPPKELLDSTTFLLKRVGFAAKERTLAAFEGSGLSPFHFAVMALLEEEPRETQAMIADALGYDRSHLVRLLDELEERGLAERRRDPSDRRRHFVSLTPEGRRSLTRLRALMGQVEDAFLAPLGDGERAVLHDLLQRLASYHDPRCALRDPAPGA